MKTLVVVLLAFACTGCIQIRPYDEGAPSLAAVNQLAANQVVYVHHHPDRRSSARQLAIDADAASWIDAVSGTHVSVPTAEIIDIRIKEGRSRQGSGFGVGLLAGASMGVMAGLSADGESTDRSTAAVLGGMGFGVLGGMFSSMMSRGSNRSRYRVIWSNPTLPVRPRTVW